MCWGDGLALLAASANVDPLFLASSADPHSDQLLTGAWGGAQLAHRLALVGAHVPPDHRLRGFSSLLKSVDHRLVLVVWWWVSTTEG